MAGLPDKKQNMSLLNKFTDHVQRENLFQKRDHLLLAVSGGADSVALCELCYQAGYHFGMVHCNFQLRGEESRRDEEFVISLGEKYGVEVGVKRFDTEAYAVKNRVSIQVAARQLRYQWFQEICYEKAFGKKEEGDRPGWNVTIDPSKPRVFLLTAHHADDNIETLLMNFFKGTGIRGLEGIPVVHDSFSWIIRPLLFAKREDILDFVSGNRLSFVEDSSNASEKYTRNYFRHQLIPSVEKVFPQVKQNLIHNIERFKDIAVLYHQSVEAIKKKLLEEKGKEIHIPLLKLQKCPALKTVVYEIIKPYGFTPHQTDDVMALFHSESGKYVSSGSYRIIRNRRWLIIAPDDALQSQHILIQENDAETGFIEGKLKFGRHEVNSAQEPETGVASKSSEDTALLDSKHISFPLLLRKWKRGDYFYPLGMPGKKKLSKFFIDQKMSITEKEKIWVIESNQRIVWIIGKRIDDRFKITGKTRNTLSIRFSKL
jgi:tRNA(Ile)-lysidine synthase